MTHPGTPRDVDLAGWLNSAGFHPADTEAKQLGHEAARQLIGLLGKHLHRLIPASREKSVLFTLLEQVRHYANQALAVNGGPPADVNAEALRDLVAETRRIDEEIGAVLPEDPRIEGYKTQQLARDLPFDVPQAVVDQATPERPFTGFKYCIGAEPEMVRTINVRYQDSSPPQVAVEVNEHDEGENRSETTTLYVEDPDVLEEFAAGFLSAANRLRRDLA